MRRLLLIAAALLGLLSPEAKAANSTVAAMTAASAFGGTELVYMVQGGADRKGTPAQFATYIYSLASGDCTISGVGAVVCTKTNGVAFTAAATTAIGTSGATIPLLSTANTWTLGQTFSAAPTFGSITGSTQCLHVNTSGVLSGTGSDCGSGGGTGANPTATAGPTAVNGVAPTFLRSDSAPAVQKASNAQFGIMEGDGATVTCTAGVCSAPPVVTSRTVTGTTDTILAGDLGNVVYYNSASAVAITQPAPSGSFAAGFFTTICQINNGVATVTPGSGTIGGASTYALPAGGTAAAPLCATYQSDGTNFNVVPYFTRNVTTTIASGTSALGTSAIGSGACATVVTVSATGTATTDVVSFGYNGDPTAVTGYGASATGAVLTIYPYPTANNVNVKVCNSSSGSITPGSMTLNFRVVR